MAIITKDVLYDMYIATELNGDESKAYQISKANSDSGYSFGQPQWDLLKNIRELTGDPRPVFRSILSTATYDNNVRILTHL